ncbi:DUF1831 domain-containing protein [Streptococcus pantholopis]|uniref:Cysteine desulfurase n=1 Tax=Streptococcus pantholopis TaxID=1811193 RepID=A0A172Q732_9STRE|nr:DUF1831 domain-containing protein [Streptococcus pantholopis]AND79299.1 cysteine desulfurase [Streptococcus pantholopis]
MAFTKKVTLDGCLYSYSINPDVKPYTLRDTTFTQNTVGHYELKRLLEKVPNSGDGFPLKITVHKDLNAFKLTITDKSGLRSVNIFKSEDNKLLQDKFYFLMDSLVERHIFSKNPV